MQYVLSLLSSTAFIETMLLWKTQLSGLGGWVTRSGTTAMYCYISGSRCAIPRVLNLPANLKPVVIPAPAEDVNIVEVLRVVKVTESTLLATTAVPVSMPYLAKMASPHSFKLVSLFGPHRMPPKLKASTTFEPAYGLIGSCTARECCPAVWD